MQTSFLQSSKAVALALVFVGFFFSVVYTSTTQVEANFFSGPSSQSSGGRPVSNTSASTEVTSESSDASLQSRLDAALKQIAELKALIATGNVSGKPLKSEGSTTYDYCRAFSHSMKYRSTDATTGGEVTRLQTFLAKDKTLYPEGEVTGFYGEATQRAVQRFQSRNGIVNSGDANTTGFGSVGGQTRMALGKMCDTVTPPKTARYKLTDVKSVTARQVDPIPNAVDDEHTLYTITLKDGTTREARRGFAAPGVFEKALRATGYTGNVDALLKMAVVETSPEVCKEGISPLTSTVDKNTHCVLSYGIGDVKTVTVIDRRTFDGDAVYTIILNNATVRTVSIGARNTTAMTAKAFKDSGYTGDISSLIAKVQTSVKVCTSGGTSYPEGTTRTSIVLPDGQTSVISDAYFLCSNGSWQKASSSIWPGVGAYTQPSGAPLSSVRGTQTSSADILLDEIFERLDALYLLVE